MGTGGRGSGCAGRWRIRAGVQDDGWLRRRVCFAGGVLDVGDTGERVGRAAGRSGRVADGDDKVM